MTGWSTSADERAVAKRDYGSAGGWRTTKPAARAIAAPCCRYWGMLGPDTGRPTDWAWPTQSSTSAPMSMSVLLMPSSRRSGTWMPGPTKMRSSSVSRGQPRCPGDRRAVPDAEGRIPNTDRGVGPHRLQPGDELLLDRRRQQRRCQPIFHLEAAAAAFVFQSDQEPAPGHARL